MSSALQNQLNKVLGGRGQLTATFLAERQDLPYEYIVVSSVNGTNGGAMVTDFDGVQLGLFPTKRDAVAWVQSGQATAQRDLYK